MGATKGVRDRVGPLPLLPGGVPFGFTASIPTLTPTSTNAGHPAQMLAVILVSGYRNLTRAIDSTAFGYL